MYRIITIIAYVILAGPGMFLFAQSPEERTNRAVYNRLEYFFNTQQSDSIYNLASDDFQKQISSAQLASLLEQLYTFGKINDAERVRYEQGIAGYRIDFTGQSILMVLGVDSTLHYHTLAFQPYTAPQEEKKEPVIAQVETVNPLDFAVDSIARTYIQQEGTQSLAVAVVQEGKINRFFYGETAKDNGTLPDANTIYEIGSITKTFTATLLADLVERGVIGLEDAIAAFLPDSVAQNPALQKVTFKTLANHTSGLPRLPKNLESTPGYDANDPYAHYDRQALFSELKNVELIHEPETAYEYSNLGYGLLGELIAIISDKPYLQCVHDVITMPLHMNNTWAQVDPDDESAAKVYDNGTEVSLWNFDAMAGTGVLKSTIDDMLRYAITQVARPENDLQNAMATTRLFTYFIPPNTDIGLAWHMNIIEDVTCYFHTGGTAGSSSFIGLIPDNRSAVIVLSNSGFSVEKIAQEIIQRVITMN